MSAEMLFAKMTAKGVNLNGTGGGGGVGMITGNDVAAALGMGNLPKLAYFIARLKLCVDESVRPQLTLEVNRLIATLFYEHKWKSPFDDNERTAHFFGKMGQIAIDEVVGVRCSTCGGRGKHKGVIHKACHGTGIKNLSAYKISDRVGVNESTWRRTWASRYDELTRQLYGAFWEGYYHALEHMGAKEAA